jgi:aryl-alcohol dehydrogenase-like predicted oxidoreductase
MTASQRLGLGTVQWGMPYGVTNSSGVATPGAVSGMLTRARQAGIDLLDTAWAYGDAETVIGSQGAVAAGFSVVTKTRPLKGQSSSPVEAAGFVGDAFDESLARLGVSSVYGLLVHHADDLLGPSGDALWALMQKLKREGKVAKTGCSLYDPAQFFMLQSRYGLDLVQLPYNIYDQRYVTSGMAERAKSSGVEVHARSAFLQGVLLCQPDHLPPHFASFRGHHGRLWRQYDALRVSPLKAALGFCLVSPYIDKVVVGCEKLAQLEGILQAAAEPVTAESLQVLGGFALEDLNIINPSNWNS